MIRILNVAKSLDCCVMRCSVLHRAKPGMRKEQHLRERWTLCPALGHVHLSVRYDVIHRTYLRTGSLSIQINHIFRVIDYL